MSWLEFSVAAATLTALNVLIIIWLTRARRRSAAKLENDAERAALHAELEMLRAENASLRSRPARPVDVRSGDSPYGRAIGMARGGAEVNAIANACAISRGEAELIVALHRSGISSA